MATEAVTSSSTMESSTVDSESNGVGSIQDLVQTKKWLENQLLELKAQLNAAQDQDLSFSQEADPTDNIAKLQTELHEVSTNVALRSLILNRAHYSQTLLRYLFPNPTAGETVETSSGFQEKQKLLMQLIEKQTKLASNILKMHEENQEKLQSLNELKKKNIDRKQRVRELMYQLTKAKESQLGHHQGEPEELTRTRERVLGLEQKAELVRHTLQGLILGSGINWAQDDHLCQLVLQLGRPIAEQ